jgi:aldose 1-epimerase
VREDFGVTRAGAPVARFTLENRRGSRARMMTLGATLLGLELRDRDGAPGDVVLGFDEPPRYESERVYFGCTTGRVTGRIAGGRFRLDGALYVLTRNEGANHLHGGRVGLGGVVWQARELSRPEGPAVRFAYTSPGGEEGYPGRLDVEVTYVLTHADELRIEYEARSDAATPVSLSNHSYFNLACGGDVLAHELCIHASRISETDAARIPTGRLLPVAGTPLDFTAARPIGRDIDRLPGGYDHNYVLDGAHGEPLARAAELYEPASGRLLELFTSEPCVQLYTANSLHALAGRGGAVYGRHAGVCLETQRFPDAVNRPEFASAVLRPGETYRQLTVYAFSVRPQLSRPPQSA